MPNYCSFDAYLVGNKEDIDKFYEVMEADYSYGLNRKFLKNLNIFKEDDLVFKDEDVVVSIGEARKIAELAGNDRAAEMLKDENLKKEYFQNIPKCGHFYRVFDYYPDEDMEKIGDNTFISRTWGNCAWSLESTVVDSEGTGYYEDALRSLPEQIMAGTNLMKFAKKVPNLKIALLSQEPGCEFSEFYAFVGGELVESRCEKFREVCYDTMKDAADDGVQITEDELGEFIYIEFPEWFEGDREEIYVNEDYVFEKLGVNY